MQPTSLPKPTPNWLLPDRLASRIDHLFNEKTILWLLRHRDDNGLAKHVYKLNSKLYVSFSGFCQWFGESPETISQWSNRSQFIEKVADQFSPASAQGLIRNRQHNGIAPFVKKVNGRLFMNTEAIRQHLFPDSDTSSDAV